jgi:hypothetical protein
LIPPDFGELKVDLAAPGMFVQTNGRHGPTFMNGSSASVAIAAGVSALLLSAVATAEERKKMRASMPRMLVEGGIAIDGRASPVRIDPRSVHRAWMDGGGG